MDEKLTLKRYGAASQEEVSALANGLIDATTESAEMGG